MTRKKLSEYRYKKCRQPCYACPDEYVCIGGGEPFCVIPADVAKARDEREALTDAVVEVVRDLQLLLSPRAERVERAREVDEFARNNHGEYCNIVALKNIALEKLMKALSALDKEEPDAVHKRNES